MAVVVVIAHAATTLSNQFTDEMNTQSLKTGADARSCNDEDDAEEDDDKLCATTNTQGRYVNGSTSDPCGTAASPDATSRFLHIEDNADIRVDDGGADDVTPTDIVNVLNSIF